MNIHVCGFIGNYHISRSASVLDPVCEMLLLITKVDPGDKSGCELESAQAKNQARCSCHVPASYQTFEAAIKETFHKLLKPTPSQSKQEIDEIVEIGYLNDLFVMARSIVLELCGFFISCTYGPKSSTFSWVIMGGPHM
ncbi:hypothetical protein VNO80_29442 [Phaseolus coccineus]|uniref:Uncharacterized protein n=1 Tax=Phaseolus coccineus TaxID=3886 RepID=A0AAN9QEW8_PHACN